MNKKKQKILEYNNLICPNYNNLNDKEALELFSKYRKMANELIQNYERRYGPINVSSTDNMKTPYAWEQDKWPWEM